MTDPGVIIEHNEDGMTITVATAEEKNNLIEALKLIVPELRFLIEEGTVMCMDLDQLG